MSLSQCVVMPQINMKVKTCAGFDLMTCWARWWWCITLPTEPSDGPFAPYCFLFLSFLPSFASPIILYLVSYRQKKEPKVTFRNTHPVFFLLSSYTFSDPLIIEGKITYPHCLDTDVLHNLNHLSLQAANTSGMSHVSIGAYYCRPEPNQIQRKRRPDHWININAKQHNAV